MNLDLCIVVLAAGQGKRMKSATSKVLFRAAGRPLLCYPLLAAKGIGARQALVVASPSNHDAIVECLASSKSDLDGLDVQVVVQERALGTGDAARAAADALNAEWTLVLYGDGPLVLDRDLRALCQAAEQGTSELQLLVCHLDTPWGYGRILREGSKADGRILAIREQRDLRSAEEAAIHEVNPGLYLVRTAALKKALAGLKPKNAQGEYYLTDIVEYFAQQSEVRGVPGDPSALSGVNDRKQLHEVEQRLFQRIAERHALAGVTVRGPTFIDDTVQIAEDVELGLNVVLRGRTQIAKGSTIDVGSVVTDSEIGEGVHLKPYSIVTESRVERAAQVGPFSQLRPGSVIGPEAHVGNFVETKKAQLGAGAKANHLAYLGDVDVGAGSNIGAGTIVCNYDGFNKWRTTIGERAFIGSDSQLISPVNIGDGAYVGTGTTVTQDVPAEALALGRAQQVNKLGYATVLRERLSKKQREEPPRK